MKVSRFWFRSNCFNRSHAGLAKKKPPPLKISQVFVLFLLIAVAQSSELGDNEHKKDEPVPCTCGVFLSGQFKKGSKDQPKGSPVLTQEMDNAFMNNSVGNRQCTNKCLEMVRIYCLLRVFYEGGVQGATICLVIE